MAKDLIKVILEPKIPMKELSTIDDSSSSNTGIVTNDNFRSHKEKKGIDEPFVKINDVILNNIDQLIIDETGLIPRIKIVWTDLDGAISGPNYPKTDPIVSVFIRSSNNKFKPIRCDFLITSIKTSRDPLNEDYYGIDYVINGELYIPKLHHHSSKSYSEMSSKDTLLTIAKESDIGFAMNDFSTNDNMTWINSNKSRAKFIQEVSKHAYLDDSTFFNSFIDKYYHLNFINVVEQLNPTHEMISTFLENADSGIFEMNQRQLKQKNTQIEEATSEIVLSNHEKLKQSPNYILNHSLTGDMGRILKTKGFKRKIYYYDHTLGDQKFTDFYMDPIKIKGYESREDRALDPSDSNLKETEVRKWMGIHYGNTHPEWNAAVLINDHNNGELNKVKLKATTTGINLTVTRGSGVNVVMFTPGAERVAADRYRTDVNREGDISANNSMEFDSLVPNDVLSGRYYIAGAKYIYDSSSETGEYSTEFHLAKVNWHSENNLLG